MWKQLNQVFVSLAHYNSRSRKHDSGCEQPAGLELSVRLQEGAELQQLTLPKKQCMGGDEQVQKHDEESPFINHPLKQIDSVSPATVIASSTPQSVSSSSHSGLYSDVVEGGISESVDSLKQALLDVSWTSHAPSYLRLVLGASCDAAARTSPYQQPVLVLLQSVATASTWQAACCQCKTDVLCRVFLQHYCPEVAVAACQAGVDVLAHFQPNSVGTDLQHRSGCEHAFLQAVAAAAAAVDAKVAEPPATEPLCQLSVNGHGTKDSELPGFTAGVTDVGESVKQLEHCIVLGETLQLLHQQNQQQQTQQQPQHEQQQESWEWLLQLYPRLVTQGDAGCHQQQPHVAPPALWLALQAWATDVVAVAYAKQQQQLGRQHLGQEHPEQRPSDKQEHPAEWKALLCSLLKLQQQAQASSTQAAAPQGLVAQHTASVVANRGAAAVAHQHFAECVEMLTQLGVNVPLLLQPGDLDLQPGTQHMELQQPAGMSLVLLVRLFVATRSSWLPMLRVASRNGSDGSDALPSDGEQAAQVLLSPNSCSEDDVDDGDGHETPPSSAAQCGQTDPGSQPEQMLEQQHASAAAVDTSPRGGQHVVSTGGIRQVSGQLGATRVPASSWPDELLNSAQLWRGESTDGEDDAAITREERTLRSWINSVLHRNASGAVSGTPTQHALLAPSQSIDSHWSSIMQQREASQQSLHVRSQSLGGSGESAVQHAKDGLMPGSSIALRRSSTGAVEAGASGSRSIHTDVARTHPAAQPEACCGEPLARSVPDAMHACGASTQPAAPASPPGAVGYGVPSRGSTAPAVGVVPSITSVSSLFGPELRSGVLLLEILDLLQPGCIDWRLANKPPFVARTAQLKALENCQLALKVAQEELGLPLVSMSPRDVVLGRRKIILSLVYQLMRYNTMQLLESISAVHTVQQAQQGNDSGRSSVTGEAGTVTPVKAAASVPQVVAEGMVPVTPPPLAGALSSKHMAAGRVNFCSSSRKQRGQLAITEQDILDWANDKLQQVRPLAGAAAVTSGAGGPLATAGATADGGTGAPVIRSFKDPVLGSGVVLLQLLHVLAPELVDLSYVTAGHTAEQRQSNARYALALADKMGCSLFLVWEDLVDPPQPRMVLVLLASLMYHDLQRQRPVPASACHSPAAG